MEHFPAELIIKIADTHVLSIFMLSHVNRRIRQLIINGCRPVLDEQSIMTDAAELNSLSAVQYLAELDFNTPLTQCTYFALHNNVAALEYLVGRGAKLLKDSIFAAIKYGSIDVLNYAVNIGAIFPINLNNITNISIDFTPVIAWIKSHPELGLKIFVLSRDAARTGNLELYKLTHNKNYLGVDNALDRGHYNIVEYAYNHGFAFDKLNINITNETNIGGLLKSLMLIRDRYGNDPKFIQYVIEIGALDYLRNCIDIGIELPAKMPIVRDLPMLEFIHKLGLNARAEIILYAIKQSNVPVVKFCVEHNYPIDENALNLAWHLDIDIIKSIYDLATSQDVEFYGYTNVLESTGTAIIIEKLEYLHSLLPNVNNEAFEISYANGDLDVVKWLLDHGYNEVDLDIIIRGDHYHVIDYLCDYYPDLIDINETFTHAIICGKINIIKSMQEWAVRTNYIDNQDMPTFTGIYCCRIAAEYRQLTALKLLRSFGYRCGPQVFINAAIKDQFAMLKYLIKNNCPYNVKLLTKSNYRDRIIKLLESANIL